MRASARRCAGPPPARPPLREQGRAGGSGTAHRRRWPPTADALYSPPQEEWGVCDRLAKVAAKRGSTRIVFRLTLIKHGLVADHIAMYR